MIIELYENLIQFYQIIIIQIHGIRISLKSIKLLLT